MIIASDRYQRLFVIFMIIIIVFCDLITGCNANNSSVYDPDKISNNRVYAEGAPLAPQSVELISLENKFQIRWGPPEDEGYSEIEGYQYDLNGDNKWRDAGDGSRHVINNLENYQIYMVRVRAVNNHGEGRESEGLFGYPSPRRSSSADQKCISRGSGRSEYDPIVLCNYRDLKALHNLRLDQDGYIDKIYISIGAHIDATPSYFDGSTNCKPFRPNTKLTSDLCTGWKPLPELRFSSVFGGGKTIFGLYSNNYKSRSGLFSKISHSSSIKDLHLRNVYIIAKRDGKSYIGGIAGVVAENSSIYDSSVRGGSVSGRHVSGGIVGHLKKSKIVNSYAYGIHSIDRIDDFEVDGMYSGGVVGWASNNSLIHSCGSSSEVYAEFFSGNRDPSAGGIVGFVDDSTAKYNFAEGLVESEGYGGMFAGGVSNNSVIEHNIVSGDARGIGEMIGGFVGRAVNSDGRNNFWDLDSSSKSVAGYEDDNQELENFALGLNTYLLKVNCINGHRSSLCDIDNQGFEFESGEFPMPKKCIKCTERKSSFRSSTIFQHFNF